MSAADPEPPVPEVPSIARLAWMLFMQPIKLRRMFTAWHLERDPSLWALRKRVTGPEKHIRGVAVRLYLILLCSSLLTGLAIMTLGQWATLDWEAALVGAGTGISIGTAVFLIFGMATGTAIGVVLVTMLVPTLALTDSTSEIPRHAGLLAGIILGIPFSLAIDTISSLTGEMRRLSWGFGLSMIVGIAIATALIFDIYTGFSASAAYFFFLSRMPSFIIGALMLLIIATKARDPQAGPTAVLWLPHRYHDLIRLPLPWLRRTLLAVAEHSPNLARELIDEASTTIAQKRPAQRAFDELQARAVRQAAEAGAWLRIIELRGSFFPAKDTLPPDDPLLKFIAAATDLHAAETGGSQHRRRNLLEKASKQIEDIKKSYLAAPTHDRRATLFYDVASAWSQAIVTRRDALIREIEQNPEIPNVFVVGPPLNPGDPEALQLFRARRDLITIIERDLDDTQRGVIFLVGQRRMGKTSLLAMLPTYLGTATTIVTCDFQGLSGSEHGRAPHRWVVQELAAALAQIPGLALPAPAVTDAWGSALSWLTVVDAELARIDHRALVAIDEVERLQDAANEGWGNLTFLDFVRAAGDKLRRIRLLLVSAHPLANPKLGRAWVDRLISVLPRTLGPLDPDDAEALLCRPVPTFPPDVFDEAAARTILAQTGRHPFLIQAVGKELVQRLLNDRRRAATAHDVERALDGVVKIAESALFTYLWDAFEPAERDIMRALAGGAPVDHETGTFRVLREQWFVDMHDGEPVVAFPLFARWIRDYRGEQPAA